MVYRMNRAKKPTIVLHFVLLFLLLPLTANAWWNDDWDYRKKITLDTSQDGVPIDARLANVPVTVRLHSGNFPYFLDVKPDASDMRFIAADDTTPLKHHVEVFDGVAGIAVIWVQVPLIGSRETNAKGNNYFWMYYGNAEASSITDTAGTYDINQTGVYHFSELSGLPQDATAFGHHAKISSAKLGVPGFVDNGAEFNGNQSIIIEKTPAISLNPETGFTFSGWLRLSESQEQSVVLTQAANGRVFEIGIVADRVYARFVANQLETKVEAVTPLTLDRWQHVAVSIGRELKLYVDGVETAATPVTLAAINGDVVLGATAENNGFIGLMDEIQFSNVTRNADWIRLAASGQGPDSKLLQYGEDESASAGGGIAEYLALLWSLLSNIRIEGWVILALIVIMGLISADVIINKSFSLTKTERADKSFLDGFAERFSKEVVSSNSALAQDTAESKHSAIFQIYAAGLKELRNIQSMLVGQSKQTSFTLNAQSLEVIRSALDAELVAQANRLNERLVLVTIAVSGGPFLGLLGTVVGVMITFAAIAAAGDVNVNTIAPGVSAALATTVMGLLVAIPSLFGYNHVASRVSKRTSTMEVFVDQFLSRLSMTHANGDGTGNGEGARDAA
jgi:biopolymer transport protein ExbB